MAIFKSNFQVELIKESLGVNKHSEASKVSCSYSNDLLTQVIKTLKSREQIILCVIDFQTLCSSLQCLKITQKISGFFNICELLKRVLNFPAFCLDLPKLTHSTADFYQNSPHFVNKTRFFSFLNIVK